MERETKKGISKRLQHSTSPTEEQIAQLELRAMNEMIPLEALLGVSKLIGFGEYILKNETGQYVIDDPSLLKAKTMLEKEKENREIFGSTNFCQQRLRRLDAHYQRTLTEMGAFHDEEYGDYLFDGDPGNSAIDKLPDETVKALKAKADTFHAAIYISPAIEKLAYELDIRIDDGLDLDRISTFGLPTIVQSTPIDPDWMSNASEIMAWINQAVSYDAYAEDRVQAYYDNSN